MKFNALFAAMLLSGSIAFAQNDDPAVMTINGQPVCRSEFEYSYNKNNSETRTGKKTVEEFVEQFVDYKLKVMAALDAHIDTTASFKEKMAQYQNQPVRPAMMSREGVEEEAHQIYDGEKQRVGKLGGLVKPAHILIRLGQKASAAEQEKARQKAEAIYQALCDGGNFAALAQKYSDDSGTSVRGGVISWIARGQTVKSFEDVVFALKVGEISKPFLSEFGYHIVELVAKQDFYPYDSVKNDILRFIDAKNIRGSIDYAGLGTGVKAKSAVSGREVVSSQDTSQLSGQSENQKYIEQEYHDGLLLYEISNRMVWEKAANDENAQVAYFAKNKKKYRWEQPRFKGIAYHVKDAADVAAVKKCVKGKPFSEWADLLRDKFNADSVARIQVEEGIFKTGDNPVVDSLVFKQNAKLEKVKGYPIDATFGKILKKGPQEYADVKAWVIADYQDQLEKEWVAALRKKYQFVVYPEVLATVNKH